MLFTFWQAGAINLKQMLENGAFPFADKLMQSIEADESEQEEAMQQGGQIPQLDQEVLDQVYSQANPQAMEMINNGLKQ
jgi:hypothetical protein